MPRLANLTNDRAVAALHWDDGDPIQFAVKDNNHTGYYIRVSSGGTKTWYYQYKIRGKLRRQWFGRYPEISCADAFGLYDAARNSVGRGIDVVAVQEAEAEANRIAETEETFTLSTLFHEHYFPRYALPRKRTWRNDKTYFETKIEPVFGARPASSLTPEDVERLIRPMEIIGFNTARLTLAVLRKMYNWAVFPSSAVNPGDGPLLNILNPCRLYQQDRTNAPEPIVRFLSDNELRQLWGQLGTSNSDRITKLQLLTGCRVTEVAGMEEQEIDREGREWNLPVTRSKTKRALNVPLTQHMLNLIGPPMEIHIFPASSKLGHTTGTGVLQSVKRHCNNLNIEGIGTHTMRRTFITNMARLGVPIEVRNRLTNHKDNSIDAQYNQHDYMQERREALEGWDRQVQEIAAH